MNETVKESNLEIIRKKISDDEMRRLIFGGIDVSERRLKSGTLIIEALNNALIAAFFVSYARWRSFDKDTKDVSVASNTLRVNKIFNNVFYNDEVNLDLIAFALVEILIDAKSNNETFFKEIVYTAGGNKESKCSLIYEVLKIIKNYSSYNLDINVSYDTLFGYLSELLDVFRFFKHIKLSKSENGRITATMRGSFEDIETDFENSLVYHSSESEGFYYYLNSVNKEKEGTSFLYKKVTIEHAALEPDGNEANSVFDSAYQNENLPDILVKHIKTEYPVSAANVDYITKILCVNYRYLKECALVLCDAITKHPASMEKIINKYVQSGKFRGVFSQKSVYESDGGEFDFSLAKKYHWDNIIIVLLLELGPTDFIKEIVDATLFGHIIDNISQRYQNDEFCKKRKIQAAGEIAQMNEEINQILHDSEQNNRWKQKQSRNIYTNNVIDAIRCSLSGEKERPPLKFIESAHIKYKKMQELIKDFDGNIVEIYGEIKETFTFIICFYRGLLSYSERLFEYEKKGIADTLCERDCIEAFTAAAKAAHEKIKGYDIVELNNEFIAFNEEFVRRSADGYFVDKRKSARLFSVISRKKICDTEVYRSVIAIRPDDIKIKPPADVFEMINTVMDRTIKTDWTPEEIEKCGEYILDFYIFLIYNDGRKTKSLTDVDMVIDPIYPYVVSYYEKSIDRDLYKKCSYKIPPIDGSNDSKIVKLLTEKDYDVNKTYYCAPRKESSTENWWIDPFMIITDIFDNIFGEEL